MGPQGIRRLGLRGGLFRTVRIRTVRIRPVRRRAVGFRRARFRPMRIRPVRVRRLGDRPFFCGALTETRWVARLAMPCGRGSPVCAGVSVRAAYRGVPAGFALVLTVVGGASLFERFTRGGVRVFAGFGGFSGSVGR